MRVIAGEFRGRRLKAPAGNATRPTIDRVRESLFGVLGDLTGVRALDVYAGTGALGIEALSRGAESSVFVESRAAAVSVLKENIQSLGVAERTTVLGMGIERAPAALRRVAPFDLVLADPPWPIATRTPAVLARVLKPLLSEHGRVVIGHRACDALDLPPNFPWSLEDERTWGDAGMSFFRGISGA